MVLIINFLNCRLVILSSVSADHPDPLNNETIKAKTFVIRLLIYH